MNCGRTLALLLLACASPLAAQGHSPGNRWHTVLTADDGTTVSIDTATVYLVGDSSFTVSTALRFSSPMGLPTGESVDRQVDAEELDCAGARSRPLTSELYAGDRWVKSTPGTRSWADVAPARRPVFDATCAFLLGGFAARERGRPLVQEPPELVNVGAVGRAIQREWRALGVMGTVNVRFRVGEDGAVDSSSVAIVDYTHEELTEPARRVANVMRFRPARVRRWPVAAWITLPVTIRGES